VGWPVLRNRGSGETRETLRDSLLAKEAKKLDKDAMADGEDAAAARRRTAITDYRKKLLNCRELESRVGTGESSVPRLPSPLSPLPPPTLLDPNLPRVRSGRFRISLED
jgi:hypothetical protein